MLFYTIQCDLTIPYHNFILLNIHTQSNQEYNYHMVKKL